MDKETSGDIIIKKETHSHIDADAEQRRYFEIERGAAQKSPALNVALIAVFFAFIYVFAILFWVLPDRTLSEEENRALASAPAFSIKALTEKNDKGENVFTKKFAEYMADQFPARSFFVGLKAESERFLLKGQNNGVIFADEGYLVQRFDNTDLEALSKNINYVADVVIAAKEHGIPVTAAVAGRKADIARRVLPAVYGTESSDGAWSVISSVFSERGVDYIDLREPLLARFDAGEAVYYRTDHHWTSLGAYYAYRKICEGSGLAPEDSGAFSPVEVTDSFFGTTHSASGADWIRPDTIELYRFDGDEELVTRRGGGADAIEETIDGLYKFSALDEKDKYSVFLGGNAAWVDISTARPSTERERILVIRDSFFNSTAPFFAKNSDLILLDLRPGYYTPREKGWLGKLCESEGIDRILILMNVETLGEDCGLRIASRLGFAED